MTRPALTVEIAFDSGVATPAASRTWTDVSTYVLAVDGIDLDHGRPDELATADANKLKLVLDNRDGRFTAGLSSSPYYPNVKIGRPIRLTATPAGQAASVRYVGYIDEWPVEWPGKIGTFATASITATSRMATLGDQAELRSLVEEEILVDNPDAYYPLSEAAGAKSATDASGNSRPRLTRAGTGSNPVFGVEDGPPTDGLTAVEFAWGNKYLENTAAAEGAATDVTLEAFLSYTASSGGAPPPSSGLGAFVSWGPFALRTSGVDSRVRFYAPGVTLQTALGMNDGTLRHFAATYNNATGAAELFVDGVSVDSGTGTTGQGIVPQGLTAIGGSEGDAGVTGVVAHAAGFKTLLTSSRFVAHAGAGLTGFLGETPATRLARYAAFAGVPSAETSFETGDLPDLAHIDTSGLTALACKREVELAEGGVLFDARDNTLTFHDRSHRYGTTAVLTLATASGEVDPGYSPKRDRFGLLNDVSAATTDELIHARVLDQTSIDAYGLSRASLDLATTNEDEPLIRASWLVGNYAEPRTRAPKLAVEVAKLSAARQAAVLAVKVGDKVTVTGLPSQSDASSKSFFVEGYKEAIDEATYRIEFNVTPAEIWDEVLILDHATLGQLDQEQLAY